MPLPNPNQMVVEGYEDLSAVVGLMEHHVVWPDAPRDRPVEIAIGGSVSEILDRSYISSKMKQTGLRRLGFMLDADEDVGARWDSIRNTLQPFYPTIPADLPPEGLVIENETPIRLGVWIMPDNKSSGMLETFLRLLVPQNGNALWDHATKATQSAKQHGASYIDAHADKAAIHCWLAWQAPPGEKFGLAITKRFLDPHSNSAEAFVKWFVRLYELQRVNPF